MKQITTDPGAVYCVYTATGCTVTDTATGCTLMTAEPGQPNYFAATGHSVTLSDADATCLRPRFKSAPAALSLLGGGADKLPAGYTRVEFLESTGNQYIDTGIHMASNVGLKSSFATSNNRFSFGIGDWNKGTFLTHVSVSTNWQHHYLAYGWDGYVYPWIHLGITAYRLQYGELNWLNSGKWKVYLEHWGRTEEGSIREKDTREIPADNIFLFALNKDGKVVFLNSVMINQRVYEACISRGSCIIRQLVPFLDPTGAPCMLDLVTRKPFRNAGSGQFIAGLTLQQAAQLGKLPAGTTLTISLPVGYDSDAGVVAALAEAEANGCVLTVQTYEAAGAAAATFALRRVWVRKVQVENGSYVAADGSRWQVEGCVDVIGADPESLGYERFRSVEAAVAYWELVPYVEPETEEIAD